MLLSFPSSLVSSLQSREAILLNASNYVTHSSQPCNGCPCHSGANTSPYHDSKVLWNLECHLSVPRNHLLICPAATQLPHRSTALTSRLGITTLSAWKCLPSKDSPLTCSRWVQTSPSQLGLPGYSLCSHIHITLRNYLTFIHLNAFHQVHPTECKSHESRLFALVPAISPALRMVPRKKEVVPQISWTEYII